MESNDKFLKIKNRTCYYFDDIIKIGDFDLDNNLIDKKLYENILVYNISYKNLIAAKPFCIRFDKIDDGNRHLVLFGTKKIWFHLYIWFH